MADGEPRKFESYDFPSLIAQVQKEGENPADFAESLDEPDLALAVHLGKYFDRRTAETLRTEIRAKKRSYDLEEDGHDVSKTPFALRKIMDPAERKLVVGNIGGFSTVHGCTGGCDWCCFDAYLTKDLETIPLAQKLHFFDEMATLTDGVTGVYPELSKKVLARLLLYGDNDAFDDTDIVPLMTHSFNQYGVTPILSTVVTKRGEENFRYLTEIAARYKQLGDLRNFLSQLANIKFLAQKSGLNTMAKVFEVADKRSALRIIRGLVDVFNNTKGLAPDLIELILLANIGEYNWALGVCGLGCVDDYLKGRDTSELDEKVLGESDNSVIEPDWRTLLVFFKVAYEKVASKFDSADLCTLNFNDVVADVCRFISDSEKELAGLPNVGTIRVSRDSNRANIVDGLSNERKYHFMPDDRNENGLPGDRGFIMVAGKRFFESGEKVGDNGISCFNGMQLSPFGLMNRASVRISHDFPQGRVLVPYKGLIKGNNLAKPGDLLSNFLSNIIVLRSADVFIGGVEHIYVYDGDKRVRKIVYDKDAAQVVSDNVVRKNVESLTDLKGLPNTLWGEALR